MTKKFKPMQPCNADLTKITYPAWAQKKYDGMKLLIRSRSDGSLEFLGRSMKPIVNRWVVETLTKALEKTPGPINFEGELQAGGSLEGCKGLLSAEYREFTDMVYYVFDDVSDLTLDYGMRIAIAARKCDMTASPLIVPVQSIIVDDEAELMALHDQHTDDVALDGTIVRNPTLGYKPGKRTVNEGFVVKIKDFMDAEAVVVGYEELMENHNEAKTNPLGRTERSSAKAGLVPGNSLGALICEIEGKRFKLGSFKGVTAEERAKLWTKRDDLVGALVKFKFMRYTEYGIPFHPVFLAFRDPIDLD